MANKKKLQILCVWRLVVCFLLRASVRKLQLFTFRRKIPYDPNLIFEFLSCVRIFSIIMSRNTIEIGHNDLRIWEWNESELFVCVSIFMGVYFGQISISDWYYKIPFWEIKTECRRNSKRMIIHQHKCALDWIVWWWAISLDWNNTKIR